MQVAQAPMISSQSRRLLFVAVVAWGLALTGCNTPTLPLPPPGQPQVTVRSDGYALLIGRPRAAEPHALVICLNSATGIVAGAEAAADGAYRVEVKANQGDDLELWQRVGSVDSPSIVVRVP